MMPATNPKTAEEIEKLANQLRDARQTLLTKLASAGLLDKDAAEALIVIESAEDTLRIPNWIQRIEKKPVINFTFDIKAALEACTNQQQLAIVALYSLSKDINNPFFGREINDVLNQNLPQESRIRNIRTPLGKLIESGYIKSGKVATSAHPKYYMTSEGVDYIRGFFAENAIKTTIIRTAHSIG